MNYKNSKFEEDIRAKYYVLRDEWNKKEELSRPNLILSTIDNRDDCYVIKDNNKFTSINGITRISCVLRGRFSYAGNIKIHIGKERGRPEVFSFDSYVLTCGCVQGMYIHNIQCNITYCIYYIMSHLIIKWKHVC